MNVVVEFCRWLDILKIIDNKPRLIASFFFTVMSPDLFCETSPTHLWDVITNHIKDLSLREHKHAFDSNRVRARAHSKEFAEMSITEMGRSSEILLCNQLL